jgi:hypothetical protein
MVAERESASDDIGVGLRAADVLARQAYLRDLNDRIATALPYRIGDDVVVLCECGRADCSDWVRLTAELYRNVRRESRWLVVLTGHELPGIDRIRQRRGSFTIVEPVDGSDGRPLPPAA